MPGEFLAVSTDLPIPSSQMISQAKNRRLPRHGSVFATIPATPVPSRTFTLLVPLVFVSLVSAWPIHSVFAWHDEHPAAREPIPEKLVVLTFDDSARSHFDIVRPILLKYGFEATFFITEGFDFATNKTDYMTWEQISQLDRDGFEIGNHTRDHLGIDRVNVAALDEQLRAIGDRCRQHSIPDPVSFAWPGNSFTPDAFEILKQNGIRFARRGGVPEYTYDRGQGFAYEPGFDHPLLIPSAGDARPNWEFDDFVRAVDQARHGKIAVLQFHGVPDTAHDWVSLSTDKFEFYMNHLARENYQVIALRDLARFVDPDATPTDAGGIIADRQSLLAAGRSGENFRPLRDENDERFWLENMLVHHRYSIAEMTAVTGMSAAEIATAVTRLGIDDGPYPDATRADDGRLKTLPFPGGRHPRTGFRDGMLRPQRETKLSVFAPWNQGGYIVADFPEAIWWDPGTGRELLYLAHTHVPTIWDQRGIELEKQEWEPTGTGWSTERLLPNGVAFGTRAIPHSDHVRFEMWIRNGTANKISDVVVQQCVMLAGATGFDVRSNDNKVIRDPFVACRNESGNAWVITAWQSCGRAWANPPCPCIHSDPRFPDCPPGQTRTLVGWVSFYQGTDIDDELDRIAGLGWLQPERAVDAEQVSSPLE